MAKGVAAKIGDKNVSANGYEYTRTAAGWRLTHHLVAEEKLGRPLEPDERVSFKDKDRTNLSPDNIIVAKRGKASAKRRLAQLEARIHELQAERADLLAELNGNG